MKRIYDSIIKQHLELYNQMIFITGARQVGKTTIAQYCQNFVKNYKYLNWDINSHRETIFAGADSIIANLPIDVALVQKPLIIFDEIHKFANWKNFLKGFYDEYKNKLSIIVTGSARLDIYRKGQDSLMGRYFMYNIFPLSIGEIIGNQYITDMIACPKKILAQEFDNLFTFGGFPEPYLKSSKQFYQRWYHLRQSQIFYEDMVELTQIHNISLIENLNFLLQHQVGSLLNMNNLSRKIGVSVPTIKNWLDVLESFYFYFRIKPWHSNITRSIIKEPKIYAYDWSIIKDQGAKIENFIACHLNKAKYFWQMMGFGEFELYFLRDKEQREIDFLVTKDQKPWLLLEVKSSSNQSISKNLLYFQKQLNAKHVLQLAYDLPYGEYDSFAFTEPKIVSLQSFLSQLP